jgi:quinol monooxygenase YgiN
MYGLIVKIAVVPGNRDAVIALLAECSGEMPGCSGYVIAKDASDENVLWVTEVWESEAAHDASLTLRAVQAAIPRIRPLVAALEKMAVTEPVAGFAPPS